MAPAYLVCGWKAFILVADLATAEERSRLLLRILLGAILCRMNSSTGGRRKFCSSRQTPAASIQ